MGFFVSLWMIWVYTALFVLLAVMCLAGLIRSTRRRARGAWGTGCGIAFLALAVAYLTGFTFHRNVSAPVSTADVAYLVPACPGPPDSCSPAYLDAVRVSDGQLLWRYPIRRSDPSPHDRFINDSVINDTFISDTHYLYLEQYAPDATHLQENVITALDAHSGRQVWQVVVAIADGAWMGAFNGRLMLSTSHTTLILDAATGKELAQVAVGNALLEQEGIVYSCSPYIGRMTIIATAEATGHQLWRSPNIFACTNLAMTPGIVVASGWGVLTAIHSTDGSLVWQVHDGSDSYSATIMGTAVYTSVPGLPGEPGYPGNWNVTVYAHALSDGRLLWRKSMDNNPVVWVVADNTVLVRTLTAIVALRGSDGRQVWSFPYADDSPSVAAVVDGVLLLGYSTSSQIVALDLQRGALYWQTMF